MEAFLDQKLQEETSVIILPTLFTVVVSWEKKGFYFLD